MELERRHKRPSVSEPVPPEHESVVSTFHRNAGVRQLRKKLIFLRFPQVMGLDPGWRKCAVVMDFFSVVQSVEVKAQIRISTKDKNTDVWQTDV